ncbi:MAG: hypothetical protein ACOC34_04220, partial [Thermotogota bacterium]
MVVEIQEIEIPIANLLNRLGLGEIEFDGIINHIFFELNGEVEYGILEINCLENVSPEALDIMSEALKAYFRCDFKVNFKNEALTPAGETVLRWKKILEIVNGSFSYVTDAVYIKVKTENSVCCHVPNPFVFNKIK